MAGCGCGRSSQRRQRMNVAESNAPSSTSAGELETYHAAPPKHGVVQSPADPPPVVLGRAD